MSDFRKPNELDAVMSSVRKMVEEHDLPNRADPSDQRAVERFVLTQALRVDNTEDVADDDAEPVKDDLIAPLEEPGQQEEATLSVVETPKRIEAEVVPIKSVDLDVETAGDAPLQGLDATIAALDAATGEQPAALQGATEFDPSEWAASAGPADDDLAQDESFDQELTAEAYQDPGLTAFLADPDAARKPEAVIDQDELRLLVSQIVREELSGELGERMTRNLRKLVRREMQRILAEREFD